jgi:hypothetical protein
LQAEKLVAELVMLVDRGLKAGWKSKTIDEVANGFQIDCY